MSNIEKVSPESLTFLSKAKTMIEKASKVDEAKAIRDKAEALRVYCKQTKQGLKIQNQLAEIRIRAERRAGEILKKMKETGEREGQGGDRRSKLPAGTLKLADLGINKSESHRFQKIAEIPKKLFEEEISTTKSEGEELTTVQFYALYYHWFNEKYAEKKEVPEFTEYLNKVGKKVDSLYNDLILLVEHKEDLNSEIYRRSMEWRDLYIRLSILGETLVELMENAKPPLKSKKASPKARKKSKDADLEKLGADLANKLGAAIEEAEEGSPLAEIRESLYEKIN